MKLPRVPSARDDAPAIRTAGTEDEAAIARLLAKAFGDDTWNAERVRSELTGAPDVKAVLVVDDGSGVIATASARHWQEKFPDAGYVHWVAVDPEARGRRLGRAVVDAVVEHFRSAGLTQVVLETDDERLPAIATYLGMGFVPEYLDADHQVRWSQVFSALHSAKVSKER